MTGKSVTKILRTPYSKVEAPKKCKTFKATVKRSVPDYINRNDVTVQFSLKMFSLYRENAFQHTFFSALEKSDRKFLSQTFVVRY
jgi:lysyl-tRNA synthetase class I